MSALAEDPQRVLDVMIEEPGNRGANAAGVYKAQIWVAGKREVITVDDYLPCEKRSYRGLYKLAFCDSPTKSLWGPILEKAFAKVHGSYAAIEGGNAGNALTMLTGFPSESIDKIHKAATVTDDVLFGKLSAADRAGHILAGSCGRTDASASEFKKSGLHTSHAYSILHLVDLGAGRPDGHRYLMQLRNPWGSGEWKGAWSDKSNKWTPALRQRLGLQVRKPKTSDGRCAGRPPAAGAGWEPLAMVGSVLGA